MTMEFKEYKQIYEIAEKETALYWLYHHKKIYIPDGSVDPEFMIEISEKVVNRIRIRNDCN